MMKLKFCIGFAQGSHVMHILVSLDACETFSRHNANTPLNSVITPGAEIPCCSYYEACTSLILQTVIL